jgi:hypothetical protein
MISSICQRIDITDEYPRSRATELHILHYNLSYLKGKIEFLNNTNLENLTLKFQMKP